jgi:tetratricopeptide (TPR) repeat protein
MKYTFNVLFILFFALNIFCEIPDIKKLWKKHDTNKVTVIKTQGDLQKALDYVNSGQYEKALEIYEKNLNKNVNSSHIHTAIGYCFEKMGDYEKAILLYNKAIALTPVDPAAYNNLAFIIAETAVSVEDVLPAIKFTDLALKYKKDDMSFLKTRLFVLKQAKLEKQWVNTVKRFLELFPNIVEINIDYGIYLFEKKDYKNARMYLNKALPEKTALEYLNKIPDESDIDIQNNIISEKKQNTNTQIKESNEKENPEKEILTNDNIDLLREFSEDYKVNLVDNEYLKKQENSVKQKKEEKDEILQENNTLTAKPGIFDLRISYDDDFEKGISNYNEGFFEKSLEYFKKYYEYCMKNKIFNEKLSRSAKYIGLINTKFGKSNDNHWDTIDFIDECVFIEKHITLMTSGSYNEAKKNLEQRTKVKNRKDFSDMLYYRILEFDNKRFSKDFNELSVIDFIYSSSDMKDFSPKSQELFSEGYKKVLEKKITSSEKYFNLAVNEDPQNFLAYVNLGILLMKIEKYNEGIQNIRTAMNRCPYNSDVFREIRKLYNSVALYFY